MGTAAQIAFDETAEVFSPAASRNHFQLLTDLTAQAARDIDLSALIDGFVDSVARAFSCDCACIALLDLEDSRAFRQSLVQYPHDDRPVQQLPIISKEETQRLSKIVERAQTVSFAGVESAAHRCRWSEGLHDTVPFPVSQSGSRVGCV